MTVACKRIQISTHGHGEMLNVTSEIAREVNNSGLNSGTVTVFIPGSTAGVTTIEFEPGLIKDIKKLGERLAPSEAEYAHNETWGDGNGFSHIRAAVIGPSLTVPFNDKKLLLGTWQQIVIIDHDNRSRTRDVAVQLIGD